MRLPLARIAALCMCLVACSVSLADGHDEASEVGPTPDPVQTSDSTSAASKSSKGGQFASLPNVAQQSVKSWNLVFAADPGPGNYDGLIGQPSDIWNFAELGVTAMDFTRFSDASPSTARLRISQHDGEWGIAGQTGILHGYIYHNCRCVDLATKILDFPAGKYRMHVYAHGDAPDQNAAIELRIGARKIGIKTTAQGALWETRESAFSQGVEFVSFDFEVKTGEAIRIISHRAGSDYSMFNAIQIFPQ